MSRGLASALRERGFSAVEVDGARDRAQLHVKIVDFTIKRSKSISAVISQAKYALVEPAAVLDETGTIYVMNEGGTGSLWIRVSTDEPSDDLMIVARETSRTIIEHTRPYPSASDLHNAADGLGVEMSDEEFFALEDAPIRKSRAVSEKEETDDSQPDVL